MGQAASSEYQARQSPKSFGFVFVLALVAQRRVLAFSPSLSTQPRHGKCLPRLVGQIYSTKSVNNLVARQNLDTKQINILSQDPLVYTIPNLLSTEECQAFRDYVANLPESRPMTRSNPPQVSLDLTKLWPLSVLSLMAGVPPVIRLFQEELLASSLSASSPSLIGMNQILAVALPNVIAVAILSILLAFGVVLPLARQVTSTGVSRTSDAVALNQPEDTALIRPLVERVQAYTTHIWGQWEAPVVTRYDTGAIFSRHGDASPTRGSEWQGLGGQRVITCICYLKTLPGKGGGETYFDQLDLAVPPVAGTALIFFPADSQSWVADDRTTHESLPPLEEKWIVQMFGRAQRVPPPLGIPDVYGKGTNRIER